MQCISDQLHMKLGRLHSTAAHFQTSSSKLSKIAFKGKGGVVLVFSLYQPPTTACMSCPEDTVAISRDWTWVDILYLEKVLYLEKAAVLKKSILWIEVEAELIRTQFPTGFACSLWPHSPTGICTRRSGLIIAHSHICTKISGLLIAQVHNLTILASNW